MGYKEELEQEYYDEFQELQSNLIKFNTKKSVTLLDAYGREVENVDRNDYLEDQAVKYFGLNWKFMDSWFRDPDNFNDEAIKKKGKTYYDELLRRDDKIYKAFWVRVAAALKRIRILKPAHKNCELCNIVKAFIKENLRKLGSYEPGTTFDNLLSQMMLSIIYGFALHEIVWIIAERGEYKDMAMLKYMKHKDQYDFTFKLDGADNIEAIRFYNAEGTEKLFAPQKFTITQFNPYKGEVYGHSAVEMRLGFACILKRFAYEFWGVRMQRHSIPSIKIELAAHHGKSHEEQAQRIAREYKSRSGVVLPKGMVIDLLEAKESGASHIFKDLIDACDKQILNCLNLTEYATDDVSGVGVGRSGGKQHGNIREELAQMDCNWLAATLNRQVIHPLIAFNYPSLYPDHYVDLFYPDPYIKNVEGVLKSMVNIAEFWEFDEDETLESYGIYLPGLKRKEIKVDKNIQNT